MARKRRASGTPGFDRNSYIFYYFQNYVEYGEGLPEFTFSNISQRTRASILQKQISKFDSHVRSLISDNGAAGRIFEQVLDYNNWDEVFKEVDGHPDSTKLSVEAAIGKTINKSLMLSKTENMNALAEELVNDISYFQQSLQAMVEKMYKILDSPQNLEAYSLSVIAEYAKAKKIPESSLGQSVLHDFLKDGLKELPGGAANSSQESLKKDIDKCILLLNALPEYNDYIANNYEKKSGKGATEAAQFFRTLFRKLVGIRQHAQGAMGEIAAEAALHSGVAYVLDQAEEALQSASISTESTGSKTSARQLGGDFLSTRARRKETGRSRRFIKEAKRMQKFVNKKDVQVNIDVQDGNGIASVNFGATVKNYTVNPKGKFMTYTISDNGKFKTAYIAAFPDDFNYQFLFNLGAGHTASSRLGGPTAKELDNQWSQMIRTVAVSNLVTALAGSITENTVFIVLNNKVFLISDVLRQILNFINQGEPGYAKSDNIFGYGQQIRGISRSRMLAASKWYGNKRSIANQDMGFAMVRSNAARPILEAMLQQATMSISLRTLMRAIQ